LSIVKRLVAEGGAKETKGEKPSKGRFIKANKGTNIWVDAGVFDIN